MHAAQKLHFEVCSLLIASLSNLQKTLTEFRDLMSNGELTLSDKEEALPDQVLARADNYQHFFERVELKKVGSFMFLYRLVIEYCISYIKTFYTLLVL